MVGDVSRPQTAPPVPDVQLTQRWGGQGRISDLGGPVHWVEFQGPRSAPARRDAPPLVLVHGLGGSHLNWVLTAPQLARHRRVFALDLAGFGLTPATGRSASVSANMALLAQFIRDIAGHPALLVGNSMGGMISLLLAEAHPELVTALVLIDPSVPVPLQRPDLQVAAQFALYAVPGVGERYMGLMSRWRSEEQRVHHVVDLCFADPSKADPDVLEASALLAQHRRRIAGQEEAFLSAARSLMKVLALPVRYQSRIRRISQPVLLIHGEQDRLVSATAARALAADNPEWEVNVLPGVGHTPQLEVPDVVVALVSEWLERQSATARRRLPRGTRSKPTRTPAS